MKRLIGLLAMMFLATPMLSACVQTTTSGPAPTTTRTSGITLTVGNVTYIEIQNSKPYALEILQYGPGSNSQHAMTLGPYERGSIKVTRYLSSRYEEIMLTARGIDSRYSRPNGCFDNRRFNLDWYRGGGTTQVEVWAPHMRGQFNARC